MLSKQEIEQIEKDLKSMKNVFDEASKSKEAAIAFLQKAGILNKKGKLHKRYRQEEEKE